MTDTKLQPTKKQLEFLTWEFGVFFHFGIRTFYEGHKDWDMKPMSLDKFNPKELDCDKWIKTIKKAGAKYAVFVAKHHDGFANWPSKYTSYSVANTPWKDGKGDVVADFVSACKKNDIKTGIYYSPADCDMKKSRTKKEHDDYFVNQISELLTGYGKVDYLWFDGCGSEGHVYDTHRIVKQIRKLQPDILLFNMWDPDTRWVGNELGLAPYPMHYEVLQTKKSIGIDESDEPVSLKFLPAECDFRLRLQNWFYSDQDEHTIKSTDELMGIYDYSVGRGANFLLNIGPDRKGLLPDMDAKRIMEFGEALIKRFSNPIANLSDFTRQKDIYTCRLNELTLVNQMVIEEDLENGQAVESFKISCIRGRKVTLYEGRTIGHKAICVFPPVSVDEILFEVTESLGNAKIKDLKLYQR